MDEKLKSFAEQELNEYFNQPLDPLCNGFLQPTKDHILKTYETFVNGSDSGCEYNLAKQLLIRLLNEKPLTAITEENACWGEGEVRKDGRTSFQSRRMPSLFKEVYPDGHITYYDLDRVKFRPIGSRTLYYNGYFARLLVDPISPITLPYYPPDKPFLIWTEDFPTCDEGLDYDTIGFFGIRYPTGEKDMLNKFYKQVNHEWVEITPYEYTQRHNLYKKYLEVLDQSL